MLVVNNVLVAIYGLVMRQNGSNPFELHMCSLYRSQHSLNTSRQTLHTYIAHYKSQYIWDVLNPLRRDVKSLKGL